MGPRVLRKGTLRRGGGACFSSVSRLLCNDSFDYEGPKCESRWADRSCWEVETRLYSDSAVAWVQGDVKEVTTLRAVETWNRHRMSS